MLHTIDDQGNLAWHCHTPTCSFHNCSAWDRGIACLSHKEGQRQQEAGNTHTAHISDPAIRFVSAQEIELPTCEECGEKMTLRVHNDEELTPPVITKDEQTGKIIQVAPHPHPKFSGNLWFIDASQVRNLQAHPTLNHLTPDQIMQLQSDIRNKAPNAPVDWMLSEVTQQEIHQVYQHPAVDRHRKLATLLTEAGKAYTPPMDISAQATPAAVYTEEQVRAIVLQSLQEHGVITSPRVPAIQPPQVDESKDAS